MKPFWSILSIYLFAITPGFSQGELVVPAGHNDAVGTVCYAPDGQLILSVSRDHLLKLWDARSGLLIRTLYGHEGRILSAAFSPSGKRILSSGKDAQLNLWDTHTGALLQSFEGLPTLILDFIFINEHAVFLAGMNGQILLLDLESGQIGYTLEQHQAPVGALELLENAAYLVSADWAGTLLLWNLLSGEVERTFSQGTTEITSIAADQAGYFYTGDTAGKLKLWHRSREQPERVYELQREAITAVKTIPAFQYNTPVCAGKSNDLYIGQPARGVRIFNMARIPAHDNWVLGLDISPDGRQIATCSWEGEINIWDANTRSFVMPLSQVAEEILSVALSEDEQYALLGLKDGSIRFIDLSAGRQQYAFPNHLSWVTDVCFAPDLSGFASASLDKTVQIQRLGDKTPYRAFLEEGGAGISSLCYWPDGGKLLYAVGDTLRLRVIENGEALLSIPVPSASPVTALAVSETDSLILAVADSSVYVWDGQGRAIHRLKGHHLLVSDACFSKDGRFILTASWDKTAVLWDVVKGQPARIYPAAEPLQAVAFSGETQFLSASKNGAISRWQISKAEPLLRVQAHERPILGLAAGATTVLSISEDHSLKIWAADELEAAARFIPISAGRFLTVSPDGFYACSNSRALLGQAGLWEDGVAYPIYLKDAQLNRPDLVVANMVHPDTFLMQNFYRAYQKRLERLHLSEEQFSPDSSPPAISIQNKADIPILSNSATITLKASVTDSVYGLKEIQVKNFGIPRWARSFSDSVYHWEGEIEVGLASGANEIEMAATNNQGLGSLPELVYTNYRLGKKQPELYLLAIGVSEYTQPAFNLNYAAKDARDMASAFQSNSQYRRVNQVLLTDEEATLESIQSALAGFEAAETDDVVIVYYAGQGILDKNLNYYLATHQTDFRAAGQGGQSIAIGMLEDWIENLTPLRKLLIIDACHSGEIDKDILREKLDYDPADDVKFRDAGFLQDTIPPPPGLSNSLDLMKELFVDLQESGLFFISSAHGAELAVEGEEWQNGVFTYAFLNGLTTGAADANGNGAVTLPEIFQYVYEKVPELTGFRQRPFWRGSPPRLDFPIWKVELK